jgi:hypothetical protein
MGSLSILCIIVKISVAQGYCIVKILVAQGYSFLIETTQMGKEKRK